MIIISLFQPSLLTFSTHISLGLFLYYGNSFYYDLIFNVLIHKAINEVKDDVGWQHLRMF